jgi:hypothetical protein
MALVSCPECKSPVAYRAPHCPKCGRPDPSGQKGNAKLLRILFGLIIIMVAGSYLWFFVIPDMQQNGVINHTSQR